MSVVGCGRAGRVDECNGVAELVNTAFDEIEARRERDGEKPETYLAIAARYEKLGRELGKRRFGHEPLTRAVMDYRNMLTSTSAALRRAAPQLQNKESPALRRERGGLETLIRQEKALVARFDAACRGH